MKQPVPFIDHPLWLTSERVRIMILTLAAYADQLGVVSIPNTTLYHRANMSVEGGYEGVGLNEAESALTFLMLETNEADQPYVFRDEKGQINIARLMDEVSDLCVEQKMKLRNTLRQAAFRSRKQQGAADV
jgi:hypothetical protein